MLEVIGSIFQTPVGRKCYATAAGLRTERGTTERTDAPAARR